MLLDNRFLLEPLFKRWDRRLAISKDDKEALLALPWSHRVFARDAYIVREGEPALTCALLVSGFAFRQKLVDSGARQIISFHVPGELVDAQNALLDVADHSVQSLNRAAVALIHKNILADLMSARPRIRQAIWIDSLIDASIFREWVVNLGRRNARARIAHLLCEFAHRLKSAGVGEGESYDFPLTQEQIADATDRKSTRLNSSHYSRSRMPSSA